MVKVIFKKLIIILIVTFVAISFTGCPWDQKPTTLNVPFHEQLRTQNNYCGIACIQMWHHYKFPGPTCFATQEMIAYELGVGDEFVHPTRLREGVEIFCGIYPHLEVRSRYDAGAKGDMISASVAGIIEGEPSILPYNEVHAVLAIGYYYHLKDIVDEYGYIVDVKPVADSIIFHDPLGRVAAESNVGALLLWFEPPRGYDYWIILARQYYAPEGVQGHNDFIRIGGTYYGGPISYNPKDL